MSENELYPKGEQREIYPCGACAKWEPKYTRFDVQNYLYSWAGHCKLDVDKKVIRLENSGCKDWVWGG